MDALLQDARAPRLLVIANYAFLLAVTVAIAAILTTAMLLQYAKGELPCPLCLIERVAMFGVCFGIIRNLRHGVTDRNTGFSLLFAILLLVVVIVLHGVESNHARTDEAQMIRAANARADIAPERRYPNSEGSL